MANTSLTKHVYRVGDQVRIVDPTFFVRCGYPLYAPDVQKELAAHLHLLAVGQPQDPRRGTGHQGGGSGPQRHHQGADI